MVFVKCDRFESNVWDYVIEYAHRRGMTRCEALEQIVREHAQLVSQMQTTKQNEDLSSLFKYGIVALAAYFLGRWSAEEE
jgi:macrodomain Ter protein organizer (MatP/YcbG family)